MLLYFGHCCGVLGYCYVQPAHPVPPMVVQLAVYVKRLAAAVRLFVWLFVCRPRLCLGPRHFGWA